jgi:hypothetical protein
MLKNAYSTSEPTNMFEPKERCEHFHTYHSLDDCYDVYLSFGSVYCDEHL